MQVAPPVASRELKLETRQADLAIVGGGFAGVCCAITAARAGLSVVLIQDRPVLGGNASSEVRLWVLGATSHMNNNNRWAREGGVADEILVENMYRNREGNSLIFDTILLEKVRLEPHITLLLNTAVYEVDKDGPDTIRGVTAFCSQNSTRYHVRAPLFCDASGDGVAAFLAGAAFRMGAEAREEFGEKFAPDEAYGELLGHSIYFYTKDVGVPVRFVPPAFALDDITELPRYKSFNAQTDGCRLWWIEYGGRLDTVHDTEKIKWELWKVVYGVWNHIKNSGAFPEAETMTLEWVGHIPGKRESRRFEGPVMLTQPDIIEQRQHDDAVSYGGWSIDLHPADGVYSPRNGCDQWHAKGIYPIPYGCLYSRNIKNLFLAGRLISASHVAFGSSRVMGTCANSAQAVGLAAALCRRDGLLPDDLRQQGRMAELQRALLCRGQHIPGLALADEEDLVGQAEVTASSQLRLSLLPADGPPVLLDRAHAQMLPLEAGPVPRVTFRVDVAKPATLTCELRISSRRENHTPDVVVATQQRVLPAGADQAVTVDFDSVMPSAQYGFICLQSNEPVALHTSEQRLTGMLSLRKLHTQHPETDIGVDTFEFWCPLRRPEGRNFAVAIEPALTCFGPEQIQNGVHRPTGMPNAWVADVADKQPVLDLAWSQAQRVARVELAFDADFDHPMESALMGHPEWTMPFCVKHYQILDEAGESLAEVSDNHQARNTVVFDSPIETRKLSIRILEMQGDVPASVFGIRCYEDASVVI